MTFGALIVALDLAASAAYLLAVVSGRTRPSRITWLIWTPLTWLTVFSSAEAGATVTLAKLVAGAIGVTAIAVMALIHGKGGRTRFDLGCLALAMAGLAMWTATDDAVSALALFMAADVVGALPMLRATWRRPGDEAGGPWLLALASSLLNLALIDDAHWLASRDGFGIWGFAIYLALLNLTMLGLIARPWLSPSRWSVWPPATIRTRQ